MKIFRISYEKAEKCILPIIRVDKPCLCTDSILIVANIGKRIVHEGFE